MRAGKKALLLSSITLTIVGGLLIVGGCLSSPRDFSSPQAIIRLVDENGSPMSGIEVDRSWYDSDRKAEGHDMTESDESGIARFAKVPARVGLFTGAGRKAVMLIATCGSGSGTQTVIFVRYHGFCKVVPMGKPPHPTGEANQDPDGVWFYSSADSQGNTTAHLTFPQKITNIDYVLLSSKIDGGKKASKALLGTERSRFGIRVGAGCRSFLAGQFPQCEE